MSNAIKSALVPRIGALMVLAAVAVIALAGPTFAQTIKVTEEPYRLRPGDVITVSVLEDPELDSEALVLPDGRISLPMAGVVRAAGKTPHQIEHIVRARISSNFVKPPTVTVSVVTLTEDDDDLLEVYVLGEVTTPGRYEYSSDDPINVLKALSLAGGLGPFAARERIQVREMADDIEMLRVFNYEALEEGSTASSRDLAILSDGAVIVVPERGLFE